MPVIPESAITFTTLVVGLLTTGVLVLLPSTWQGDGRALRYWVIGNLALSADRLLSLAPDGWGEAMLPGLLVPLSAACVALGAGMHVAAVRLQVQPERRPIDWRWPGALALAQAVVGLVLQQDIPVRIALICCTSACIVQMLVICWPRRRQLRGALVMSGAMGFFLLMDLAGLWELGQMLLAGPAAAAPGTPMAILALDLVLSVVVNLAFLLMLIELLHQRVAHMTITDPLTGVLNRRGFAEAANQELQRAERRRHAPDAASVLLLDLDHFKRINDSLGHPMGDAVLRGAAERVAGAIRQTDVLARWGGEEFVVLLSGSRLAQAQDVAERIRQAVSSAPMADGAPIVTVSIGAAARDGAPTVALLQALIAEADRRLYLAKRRRNCVVAQDMNADGPPGELPDPAAADSLPAPRAEALTA